MRREKLLRFAILPVLLNVVLVAGAIWAASSYWRQELGTGRRFGADALSSLLLIVTTALGAIVLFVIVQPLLGAVFSEVLSGQVERQLNGQAPRVPFLASTSRALGHGVLKLVLYGAALLIGLSVSLATPGVGCAVGVGLAAVFFAYDGFDYPLARRGASFGGKWKYLALHPMQTIGYGLGTAVLYLVPLALVIAPPLMAAGATMVYLETETRKITKGRKIDETSALRDRQG